MAHILAVGAREGREGDDRQKHACPGSRWGDAFSAARGTGRRGGGWDVRAGVGGVPRAWWVQKAPTGSISGSQKLGRKLRIRYLLKRVNAFIPWQANTPHTTRILSILTRARGWVHFLCLVGEDSEAQRDGDFPKVGGECGTGTRDPARAGHPATRDHQAASINAGQKQGLMAHTSLSISRGGGLGGRLWRGRAVVRAQAGSAALRARESR